MTLCAPLWFSITFTKSCSRSLCSVKLKYEKRPNRVPALFSGGDRRNKKVGWGYIVA